MLGPVTVLGSGVAALCCAALLAKRGIAVALRPTPRHSQPVLGVSDDTLLLLEEIFGRPLAVRILASPRWRVVDWQHGVEAAEVAHPMQVVREEDLLAAMTLALPRLRAADGSIRIVAGGRAPSRPYRFGNRRMRVEMTDSDGERSRMTAGPEGWAFAMPLGGGRGLVQTATCDGSEGTMCAPSIRWPLAGENWFLCGPAAMALDPLCGDGVGFAARSALWLCELLVEMGPAAARGVYAARLTHAFRAHLAACLELYGQARFAGHWSGELAATERGLAAMDKLLTRQPLLGRQPVH